MMTNKKKLFSIIALCLLICLCLSMTACRRGDTENSDATEPAEAMIYTIELKSEGGLALEGVGIYVYTDSTQQELVWFAKTDAEGKISFADITSDGFVAVLDGVPEGYEFEESYTLTGENTQIVLAGGLAAVGDLASADYKLGSLVGDFTVTTPDGTEYVLSELLKEKKAVVLNFWYTQCQPCRNEFPYMQEAYEAYSDEIEILAMNPVNTENEEIEAFQKELDLTFPMAACDPDWEKAMQLTAYPTTVVIDRFGTIALIHKGSITDAQTFVNIFDFFAAEDYVQTTVEDLEDLPEAEDLAVINNPKEIGGVSSFDLTVKAGESYSVDVYKVQNMYLSIKSENVYVVYNNTIYYSSGGSVGLVITAPDMFTPVTLTVGNTGKKTETFTLNLSQFAGTYGNPYTLELTEFTTSVNAGNDQGVYYRYTAEADGTMNVRCLQATGGVKYDFILYNLTSYAYRNFGSEGVIDEDGYPTVSVKVRKGDQIQFSVGTLPDSSNSYPAGTFTFSANLVEGDVTEDEEKDKITAYTITVTDENRKPVSGVFLKMNVDGKETTLTTNENGVASTKLKADTYNLTLVTPDGYTADTTDFLLTEEIPAFSLKLNTFVRVEKTYTVKTVDEEGKPVAGTLVTLDTNFAYTDETGCASFTLQEGEYTAIISAPNGYVSESITYPFEQGSTELTVVLKADDGSKEETEGNYHVTVVDYSGAPVTGVVVQFLRDGQIVAMQPVNDKGVASAQLEPGDYTVNLAFSGTTRYYNEKTAVLSAEVTSIQIVVVDGVSGEYKTTYAGNAYYVTTGATYVTMQANVTNYFIFEPDVAGVYRFSTSDPEAILSYWGSSTAFLSDITASTDYADNVFTLNIKENMLGGTNVIGITGADHCILEIVRVSDPILDDTDVVPEIYVAKTTPTPFTLNLASGKKLTYVDVTKKTSDYTLVYNGSDGYYHLNSASGPVMYVDLGTNAPYVSMYNLLGYLGYGGTSLTQSFYDESGKLLRREDYTTCMMSYVECIDETYGVYPLNDDLIYMFQQAGDYKGWWDSSNGNYVFKEVENLNTEIAWMFACCYAE